MSDATSTALSGGGSSTTETNDISRKIRTLIGTKVTTVDQFFDTWSKLMAFNEEYAKENRSTFITWSTNFMIEASKTDSTVDEKLTDAYLNALSDKDANAFQHIITLIRTPSHSTTDTSAPSSGQSSIPLTKTTLASRRHRETNIVAANKQSFNSIDSVVPREGKTIKIRHGESRPTSVSETLNLRGQREIHAALITGVSGSGKTMYASRVLPDIIRQNSKNMANATTVTTLISRDAVNLSDLKEAQRSYENATDDGAKTEASHKRATVAFQTVKKLLYKATNTSRLATSDEESPEGIIFVIDEIGTCLDLARAVVGSLSEVGNHFDFPIFFIFAGTSLDLMAATLAKPSTRASGTTNTAALVTIPSDVLIIEMRDVDPNFWLMFAQDMARKDSLRNRLLPAANDDLLDVEGRVPIIKSLRCNPRAGWLALEWVMENISSTRNASKSDIVSQLPVLLQYVGKRYKAMNGLSSVKENALREFIKQAVSLSMSYTKGNAAQEQQLLLNIARIGLVYFDYDEERPKMPLAIAAMCLSTFGISTVPAINWSTFESVVASNCHLAALAKGHLVETIALTTQFPARASTEKDMSNWNRIQVAQRIGTTWSYLRSEHSKQECTTGFSLVILNGPHAPFADVFVLHSFGIVELVQCKRYKDSTIRKFSDRSFHEEVLKLGLHCNRPTEPHASELAATLHQLVDLPTTWEGVDMHAPCFMTAVRSASALDYLLELVAGVSATTTTTGSPEVHATIQFAENPSKWDAYRDDPTLYSLTAKTHAATLKWGGKTSNLGILDALVVKEADDPEEPLQLVNNFFPADVDELPQELASKRVRK